MLTNDPDGEMKSIIHLHAMLCTTDKLYLKVLNLILYTY